MGCIESGPVDHLKHILNYVFYGGNGMQHDLNDNYLFESELEVHPQPRGRRLCHNRRSEALLKKV